MAENLVSLSQNAFPVESHRNALVGGCGGGSVGGDWSWGVNSPPRGEMPALVGGNSCEI